MSNRIFVFISILATCAACTIAPAFAQVPPEPKQPGAAQTSPIEFRLADGEVGACGPGCSEWIAAQGKIDAHAADRLRQLLNKLQGRKPPIFFHSPGGSVNGSLELGRLIHEKKFETSVGRTVPRGCDSDKPDKSCSAQNSENPAQSEISQFVSECNSGCVYALAGGATHFVPPWVKLGIHDAGFDPDIKLPRGAVPALGILEAHQRTRAYLRDMGMDAALFSTILGTPFEMPKLLQRDDIVRFGLDRREFGETAWQLADTAIAQIRKRFFVRVDGEQPHYVNGLLQVACSDAFGMTVGLVREPLGSEVDVASAGPPVINITFGGKQIALGRGALPNFYVRAGRISSLDSVTETTIELPGTELGRKERGDVTLSMDGFTAAYAKLRPRCSPPPSQKVLPAQKGLQALVQQFQAKPERYGVSQANPWALGNAQVPARPAAVAPATNKQPPTVEFSRFATAENKLRIDFLFLLKPDCSSAGKEAVGVIEQPQHGTLSIETSQGLSDFPEKDPRAGCNAHSSGAVAVFYQPNKDYQGPDSASVSITPPLGGAMTHHYTIRVK